MQVDRLNIVKSGHMKAADAGRTGKAGAAGSNPEYFAGVDLHKKFVQVAIMDSGGRVFQNKRVERDPRNVARAFSKVPAGARCVLESSSAWYGMHRFLSWAWTVLSNPLAAKRVVDSKKKKQKEYGQDGRGDDVTSSTIMRPSVGTSVNLQTRAGISPISSPDVTSR